MRTVARTCVILMALSALARPALAQLGPAPVPQHLEPFIVDSGKHDGNGLAARLAYSTTAAARGAPWLQVHFGDCTLGQKSFVVLTSVQDGQQQTFHADSLAIWQHASAYFNGDTVTIELYVAPDDDAVSVKTARITVGEWVGGGEPGGACSWPCGICDDDDRVPSADPRVGRITIGCTGWLISNGACLTAGHCIPASGDLGQLHFNIPLSNCDGTLRMPAVVDQYPILTATIVGRNTAGHDDWCVFSCGPNSVTGLLPAQAQGDFFRLSRDFTPDHARVTGYGVDEAPPGCSGGRNEFSQVQQTHSADFNFDGSASLDIEADLTCGDSGGPAIHGDFETIAMGIVTRCTFSCNLDDNHGTGFVNTDLAGAIDAATGPQPKYVDVGHVLVLENGTMYRPFDTVTEGVNAVASGGVVSIVAGVYPAAAGNTFIAGADGRAMRLVAPVGPVRIGN